MKIQILPEELVKRCLWDSYVYYVLGSEKEGERILKENNEVDLSEKESLIIGLLKVIETDNLIFKFNTYIVELLTNKSSKVNEYLLIRKKTMDSAIDKFLDKFPDYWTPNSFYIKALKDLVEYIDTFKVEVEKLEIHKVVDKNITYEFYNSQSQHREAYIYYLPLLIVLPD